MPVWPAPYQLTITLSMADEGQTPSLLCRPDFLSMGNDIGIHVVTDCQHAFQLALVHVLRQAADGHT